MFGGIDGKGNIHNTLHCYDTLNHVWTQVRLSIIRKYKILLKFN